MAKLFIPASFNQTNQTIDLNETLNLTREALTKHLINLSILSDPDVVVTTWTDIKLLVLITGVICMVAGYLIAEFNHYIREKKLKR